MNKRGGVGLAGQTTNFQLESSCLWLSYYPSNNYWVCICILFFWSLTIRITTIHQYCLLFSLSHGWLYLHWQYLFCLNYGGLNEPWATSNRKQNLMLRTNIKSLCNQESRTINGTYIECLQEVLPRHWQYARIKVVYDYTVIQKQFLLLQMKHETITQTMYPHRKTNFKLVHTCIVIT